MKRINASMNAEAGIESRPDAGIGLQMKSIYEFKCFNQKGDLAWETNIENIVVNVGLDDLLDKYFKGSTYTAAHYVALKNAGTASAGDTMASHASWVENTSYSKAARPTLVLGTVSGQAVDNSASQASFDITTATSVAGAFLTTSSTKGGTTGTLYGVADFASARSVNPGDTLSVKLTLTAATS